MNFFNPKGITSSTTTPRVFLSDFKLANKSIKPGQDHSPLEKVIGETSKLALNYNQSLFTIDFYGIILLFLGYFVGILSLLALDNRIFFNNIKYLFSMNIFIVIVYFYVFSMDFNI